MSQKIIYDCDNTLGILFKEVDDGLTIRYLMGVEQIKLLGITTTFGNGTIDQVYEQTNKLVRKLQIDSPVFKGEGLSNQRTETPAAQFLVKAVNDHPGEITLLATGPLGNLHTASRIDPVFYSKVKEITLMGGYLEPLRLGYRHLKELNLSANPAAAHSVLHATCPVTIFSAQACLDAPFGINDILQIDYWPANLKWVLLQWWLAFGLFTGEFVFYLWDLLPAVYLTMPKLFTIKNFRIGSSFDNLQAGNLVEGHSTECPQISLATGIKDQAAFFNHLDLTWRNAAEKYPLKSFL